MRILFCIPHYFCPSQNQFHGSEREAKQRLYAFEKCLAALNYNFRQNQQGLLQGSQRRVLSANKELSHQLEVIVCTTGNYHLIEQLPANLCRHYETSAQPRLLGYECHQILRDGLDQFDFFCYLEDDLLINDALLFSKLKWFSNNAGNEALLQPNRFELNIKPFPHKIYVDGDLVNLQLSQQFQDRTHKPKLEATLMGEKYRFQRVDNPHSGCFFLNAAQMRKWVVTPYFLDRASDFWGPLESAATLGIMKTFNVYKPSQENAAFLEIEHLDPRYEIVIPSDQQHISTGLPLRRRRT
ncbi:MAG: calcium-binding protein [Cyanothece sp. SIO1E1]|nr:calcium-binding protein [Cyanothece sp. SIO1E1]